MKQLAIIGAAMAAVDYANAARRMGVISHCFAWRKGALAIEAVDYFYDISIFEKDKIVEKCREIGINGVVATTELTIPIAAYVADQLQLNGMNVEVANQITDKYRNRLASASVKELYHPRFACVDSEKEIDNLDFSYPLIIKPTNKGGKRGITVVNRKADVSAAVEYLIQETGTNAPMVIEEYIAGGEEYSVESLSFHGKHYIIQVTQKISSGPPHCVELGHFQPASLSFEMRKKVENVIIDALKAIGMDNGPCHTEIKIKDNKIYLIEFNARPGGDRISGVLTELSTGYQYFNGMIEVAFGELYEVDISKLKKCYSGIYFITEQTKKLKPIFDICQNFSWCYEKHVVADELPTLVHNNGMGTNYFIYCSENEMNFQDEVVRLLEEYEE